MNFVFLWVPQATGETWHRVRIWCVETLTFFYGQPQNPVPILLMACGNGKTRLWSIRSKCSCAHAYLIYDLGGVPSGMTAEEQIICPLEVCHTLLSIVLVGAQWFKTMLIESGLSLGQCACHFVIPLPASPMTNCSLSSPRNRASNWEFESLECGPPFCLVCSVYHRPHKPSPWKTATWGYGEFGGFRGTTERQEVHGGNWVH